MAAKATATKSTNSGRLEVTISADKKTLHVTIPINPKQSASGKNLVIATTSGIAPTEATYNGQVVKLGLNAMIGN